MSEDNQIEMEVVDDQQTESREVSTRQSTEVAQGGQMESLLQMAISQDIDVEKLDKLIELKNREEERQCKKDFDYHFAEMQRKFKPVKKSKEGYGYNYAPLEQLQKEYGDIIAQHGFAYRWREEPLNEGGKRIVLIISGWGHTDEKTTFDIPALDATKQQNKAQVLGSMTTYGKRYTFMSGFGIIVEDEDDDTASLNFEDGVQYSNEIQQIRSCSTLDELKEVFGLLYKSLDRQGKQIITIEKDKKKKGLSQ